MVNACFAGLSCRCDLGVRTLSRAEKDTRTAWKQYFPSRIGSAIVFDAPSNFLSIISTTLTKRDLFLCIDSGAKWMSISLRIKKVRQHPRIVLEMPKSPSKLKVNAFGSTSNHILMCFSSFTSNTQRSEKMGPFCATHRTLRELSLFEIGLDMSLHQPPRFWPIWGTYMDQEY